MNALPHSPVVRRGSLLLRLVAAIYGSYACTASLVSAGAAVLVVYAGMARSEAVYLTAMLGLLVYLGLLLWSFAASRLWWVWSMLLAGTVGGLSVQTLLGTLPVVTLPGS
jgi:hypothetical protein